MFHECRHIKTDGLRCHAAALRGKPWCYFHDRLHRMHRANLPDSQKFQLPPIEDSSSVLIAIGQVIRSLNSPYMDSRRAGLFLYGLQIAAQLTNRAKTAKPSESVRTLYNLAGAPVDPSSTAFDDDAELLAPDKTVCEPPHDCPNCPRQETCDNYQEPDDDDEEDSEDEQDEDALELDEDDPDPDDDEDDDDESDDDDDESGDDDTDDMEDDD
ncbi:MAG: hypothetical protein WCA10_23955 [Terracidiphilus sp.]